jgi:hypothetical protein
MSFSTCLPLTQGIRHLRLPQRAATLKLHALQLRARLCAPQPEHPPQWPPLLQQRRSLHSTQPSKLSPPPSRHSKAATRSPSPSGRVSFVSPAPARTRRGSTVADIIGRATCASLLPAAASESTSCLWDVGSCCSRCRPAAASLNWHWGRRLPPRHVLLLLLLLLLLPLLTCLLQVRLFRLAVCCCRCCAPGAMKASAAELESAAADLRAAPHPQQAPDAAFFEADAVAAVSLSAANLWCCMGASLPPRHTFRFPPPAALQCISCPLRRSRFSRRHQPPPRLIPRPLHLHLPLATCTSACACMHLHSHVCVWVVMCNRLRALFLFQKEKSCSSDNKSRMPHFTNARKGGRSLGSRVRGGRYAS